MKKVLAITGSPKFAGSSETLADAFLNSARQMGHTCVKFQCAMKNIRPCINCNTCFSSANACTLEDDFNELAKYLPEADVVLFAFPLYWFTFPASIKLAIDKFYAFMSAGKNIRGKDAYLIVTMADTDLHSLDGLTTTYAKILEYLDWHDMGHIFVPNADNIEIDKSDFYNSALEFGRSV